MHTQTPQKTLDENATEYPASSSAGFLPAPTPMLTITMQQPVIHPLSYSPNPLTPSMQSDAMLAASSSGSLCTVLHTIVSSLLND